MKPVRAKSKAQSSLEYLVLTAAILVLATVTVSLVTQSAGTKTTVEYTYCQAAAKQCAFSLQLDPSYECTACDKQCVDSIDRELFNGAINLCKAGNFSAIFES